MLCVTVRSEDDSGADAVVSVVSIVALGPATAPMMVVVVGAG